MTCPLGSSHPSPSECPTLVTGESQSAAQPVITITSFISFLLRSSLIQDYKHRRLAGSFPFPHLHPKPSMILRRHYIPDIHPCHTRRCLSLIKCHSDDTHVYSLRAQGGCYSLSAVVNTAQPGLLTCTPQGLGHRGTVAQPWSQTGSNQI